MKLLNLVLSIFLFTSVADARGGGGFSSGGGRSFSSGSHSYSSSSSSSSGKSYSSASKSSTPSKSASSWDSSASKSASADRSRSNWFSSSTPKYTYTRPTVSTYQVQTQKQTTFYSGYRSNPIYVQQVHHYHYNDGFSPWFWIWMMDRGANDRAIWAYNHQSDMDAARMAELRAKDAEFDQRLAALEKQGLKADPNYQPAGVDKDLVYKTDDDVKQDKKYEEESQGMSAGQIEQLLGRRCSGLVPLVLDRKA